VPKKETGVDREVGATVSCAAGWRSRWGTV